MKNWRNLFLAKLFLSVLFIACSLKANSQGGGKRFEKDSAEVKTVFLEIEKGNYETAFKLSLEKAKLGNPIAQYIVGSAYSKGVGVTENDKEGFNWIKLAAEKGYSHAQTSLALMYSNSEGVPQDYSMVISWFKKAAEQNDEVAIYHLTTIYGEGLGVEKNYDECMKWINRGAKLNYASSEKNMGIAYKNGIGVDQNDSIAIYWFKRAAEHGDAESQLIVGKAYLEGFIVKQNDSCALEWFKKCVNQKSDEALQYIVFLYENEKGMLTGLGGITNLGISFLEGKNGLVKDSEIAYKLFQTNATYKKDGKSYYYLGVCSENGEGVEKDIEKAKVMYLMAVTYGYQEAEKDLKRLEK